MSISIRALKLFRGNYIAFRDVDNVSFGIYRFTVANAEVLQIWLVY